MAARPAKRQRRSTVIASDDDEDSTETSGLPLRTQQLRTRSRRDQQPKPVAQSLQTNQRLSHASSQVPSAKPSPTSSPQKGRKVVKQDLEAKSNKSLHSFFSKASEEQRWQRRAETPQQMSQEDLSADEIVDDDDDDDFIRDVLNKAQPEPVDEQATTPSLTLLGSSKANGSRSSTPVSSQRFARSVGRSHLSGTVPTQPEQAHTVDHRPWAERYGPSNIDELAVHKKKVADVHKWLEDVGLRKTSQRILVLKGPAGSGKSTTLSLVARQSGISTVSWHNPNVSDSGSAGSIQQFADFLDRGGQFDVLPFDATVAADQPGRQSHQRLLMVEEYPISMTRSSTALDSFRSILLEHLLRNDKASRPSNRVSPNDYQPLVLIVSETLLNSSTALSDSFTAHRLLGPELSHHPLVSVIEFNPVAPTFVSKAIDLVIKKEARDSMRRRIPGPSVLQQLSEVGDIRSAINRLEFLCARGDDIADWSGTVASLSKKVSKSGVPLTNTEKSSLQLIGQRESTLDMFHAAGKIVYNKREDPRAVNKAAESPLRPPDHLAHLHKSKTSQVDVDALLGETGTDVQTFISTLHENYVLSCNGDDFVDSLDNCSKILSDSDGLNPDNRIRIRAKGSSASSLNQIQSGNYDMLRQDEISFQVACRGMLFSLPFPVSRAVPAGSRKQDAFKMFYPASLRLWKPTEEIHDLVSLYAAGIDHDIGFSVGHVKALTGVAAWKSKNLTLAEDTRDEKSQTSIQYGSGLPLSRESLVTEYLPYLAGIRTARNQNVRVLEKITQFRGIRITDDELLDEEQQEGIEASVPNSLEKKVEEAHKLLQARMSNASHGTTVIGKRQDLGRVDDETMLALPEKLYISDDDIQDD